MCGTFLRPPSSFDGEHQIRGTVTRYGRRCLMRVLGIMRLKGEEPPPLALAAPAFESSAAAHSAVLTPTPPARECERTGAECWMTLRR